jgi:hypothetical protein
MIDKLSGKVCYAIMSFGGFLGIRESDHPLPWQKLDYDKSKGGFVVRPRQETARGRPVLQDQRLRLDA